MGHMTGISWSRFRTWRRCPKKYEYRYVLGLKPKVKPQALQKGYWLHQCLAAYYQQGDWQPALDAMLKSFQGMFDEEREFYGEMEPEVRQIMEGYHRFWRGDKDWKIVAVEKPFKLVIKNLPPFRGIIDLLVRDPEGLWIVEHKSSKRISPEPPLVPDPQSLIYVGGLKIQGKDIKGHIRNLLRTKPPTEPHLLKKGGLPRRIDTDERTLRQAIETHNLDPKDYVDMIAKARLNPFYARFVTPLEADAVRHTFKDLRATIREIEESRRFCRTIQRDCSWTCDYVDLCMMELRGLDSHLIIKSQFGGR